MVIQFYSLQAILSVQDNTSMDLSSVLLRRIHRIFMQRRQWILKHVSREINKITDNPPREILKIVSTDKLDDTFAQFNLI